MLSTRQYSYRVPQQQPDDAAGQSDEYGGAAVFIGLAGSVVGLLLGHAVSVLSGGKHIAPPVFTTTADAPRVAGRIIGENLDV